MHVWNVLHVAHWNTGRKKSPFWHHRTTLSGCISTRPHNMVNFGLLTAEICWQVWNTPANFNGFHILAALLARHSSSGRQPWAKLCGVEQRAPPIFGRAAITLGIGPHSSLSLFCVFRFGQFVCVLSCLCVCCYLNVRLHNNILRCKYRCTREGLMLLASESRHKGTNAHSALRWWRRKDDVYWWFSAVDFGVLSFFSASTLLVRWQERQPAFPPGQRSFTLRRRCWCRSKTWIRCVVIVSYAQLFVLCSVQCVLWLAVFAVFFYVIVCFFWASRVFMAALRSRCGHYIFAL